MLIEAIIKNDYYKRLLIVDDEADITSIGYERAKGQEELSLRRISGAINTMRKALHSNIEHVLMQVTATPYALYLQPENFYNSSIMPIKPTRTVVIPTGKGYIGGRYYFIDSEDGQSARYDKAKHLLHIVKQDEMDILNGSRKNSGKNSVINDKRTVRMDDFLKSNFALGSLRNWIFDILVGTAIVQHDPDNQDYYLSAVIHAATTKILHKSEKELIETAFSILTTTLQSDINNDAIKKYITHSYNDIKQSVEAHSVLTMPSLREVIDRIVSIDSNGEIEGLINEVDIKEVNSDSDISRLLNLSTGELKLENSLTIFVGGQVLDRGITIPNMISFFYGRDPKTMQQDTVMQHCRMFGYRGPELLSVTRFYTTYRLFSSMKEITIRDNLLRERMLKKSDSEVIYLEAGGKIKACSPQKVLASEIRTILPEKRYLPVGFDVDKKSAKNAWKSIDQIVSKNNGYLPNHLTSYEQGDDISDRYVTISSEDALDILMIAYSTLIPKDDGVCNTFSELESVFLFSLSEQMKNGNNNIALIVRQNRKLTKLKRNDTMYQDAPDDGKNEGAIAKILRNKMPVLILTEQTHPEWGSTFWWPIYYTPNNMNVGIYSEECSKTGVYENVYNAGPIPIQIEKFNIVDNIGIEESILNELCNSAETSKQYYLQDFAISDAITTDKTRKNIICPVYIDDSDMFSAVRTFETEIKAIEKNVEKIFEKLDASDMYIQKIIISYLEELLEGNPTDESREKAIVAIDSLKTGKTQKQRLRNLIYEADELNQFATETLGYFMPLGSGRCEIHLNYSGIVSTCEKETGSEEGSIQMLKYILSHELFHAMHYSDVMTQSGRWLHKSKDYHKQCVVKETMAEYFALSYAKTNLSDATETIDIVKYIHNTLKQEDFPKDGGYSGALILENNETDSKVGKNNLQYKDLFNVSLFDMPLAFKKFIQNI